MRLHEDHDGIWRSLDDLPPILPWYRKSYLAALLVILGLAGCGHCRDCYEQTFMPAQSWDQANLKAHDSPEHCRPGTRPFYTTWPDGVPTFLECQ